MLFLLVMTNTWCFVQHGVLYVLYSLL